METRKIVTAVKTILITGASAGIGAATALQFAKSGATLILGARRLERLGDLQKSCIAAGAAAVHIHALDVCDDQNCGEFYDWTKTLGLVVDVLINNAGLALGTDPIAAVSTQDANTMMDTNVHGVLRMLKLFLPEMIQRQSGHLVFLGSIAGWQSYEGGAVYCATKHALRAITTALKLEVNGKNIRVSSIDPGMVETEFSQVRFAGDTHRAANVYKGLTPLSAEDIASCIRFVVDAPAHMNVDHILLTPTAQANIFKTHRNT